MLTEEHMKDIVIWSVRLTFSSIVMRHALIGHLSLSIVVLFFPDVFFYYIPKMFKGTEHEQFVIFCAYIAFAAACMASFSSILWFSWFCQILLTVSINTISTSPIASLTLLEICHHAYVVLFLTPSAINSFGKTTGFIKDSNEVKVNAPARYAPIPPRQEPKDSSWASWISGYSPW